MKTIKKIEIAVEIFVIVVFICAVGYGIKWSMNHMKYMWYYSISSAIGEYVWETKKLPDSVEHLCDWKNQKEKKLVWDTEELSRYIYLNHGSNLPLTKFIILKCSKDKKFEQSLNDNLRNRIPDYFSGGANNSEKE